MEMKSIFVILCMAGLWANVRAESKCGDQYSDHLACIMDIVKTTELQSVLDKKIEIFRKTCTGYPENCTLEWGTMLKCAGDTIKGAKDDSELKSQMDKTEDAIDKCFETPSYPYPDLDIVFSPPFLKAMLENPSIMNKTDGDDDDEGTSQWPMPRPDQVFRKECQPQPEHIKCLMKQMGESLKSPEFYKTIGILLLKINVCRSKVKFECIANTPDQKRCFFAAHKDVFKLMFDRVSKCTKQKLGNGPANDSVPDKGTGSTTADGGSTSTQTTSPSPDSSPKPKSKSKSKGD